jgi:hypothetical protein
MSKKRNKSRRPKVRSAYMYTFPVKRSVEHEKEVSSTNTEGDKVVTTKMVDEVISEKIQIKRPSRKMYDDAELFYGVKLSEGIKAGLLTKALLAKRYEDDGGSMSEREKAEYFQTYYALLDKENEYQRTQLNLDNLDPEQKEIKLVEGLYDILELRKNLRDIEEAQASLFNQTAENRARNQVLMWWVLQLGFMKGEPIFPGDNFDERADIYDDIEDQEEPFWDEVVKKLAYFISFWYSGQATDKDDFDKAMDIYKQADSTEGDETEDDMEPLEDVEERDRVIREERQKQEIENAAIAIELDEATKLDAAHIGKPDDKVLDKRAKEAGDRIEKAIEKVTAKKAPEERSDADIEEEIKDKIEKLEEKAVEKAPEKAVKKRKPRKRKTTEKPNEDKEEG